MIKNTFLVLDGIGEKTERLLWQRGILSWEDFLHMETMPGSLRSRKQLYRESLLYFLMELEQRNEKPFVEFLHRRDHWRLFDAFKDDAICLDIETNGLPCNAGGEITVIGLYGKNGLTQYVKGINLTEEAIREELFSCKLLITFYGSVFDIPFMKRTLCSIDFRVPHFDLCFAARKLGHSGGLKRIEAKFGFERGAEIRNLTGFDAVSLWREWERGATASLETLLSYNRSDTENLFGIAHILYEELCEQSGFRRYREEFAYR